MEYIINIRECERSVLVGSTVRQGGQKNPKNDDQKGSVKGSWKMSYKPEVGTSMGRWKRASHTGEDSMCKDPVKGRVAHV